MRLKCTKFAALLFAVVLFLSGCSMITIDKDMDNAEVVAEFTGGTVTKGEAMELYDRVVQQYAMYGVTDQETLNPLKGNVIIALVKDKIMKAKAEELGFMTLSAEDEAAKKEEAKTEYNNAFEMYKVYFEEDGVTDEEVTKSTNDFLAQQGITIEAIEQQLINDAWQNKLKDSVTADVAVTEEELKAEYEQRVADDEALYVDDTTSFEAAMMNGAAVAWVPEGYRTVKHILIKMTDEQQSALDELEMELEDVQLQLDEMTEPVEATAESTEEPTEGETEGIDTGIDPDVMDDVVEPETDGEEPAMTKEELEAKKTELTGKVAAKKAEIAQELQVKVDEVMARIEAGEDFQALAEDEAVGGDDGMRQEPIKTIGYYVSATSESWDQVFKDAAMSIQNVGEIAVSELGTFGIHIVRYESDATPGPVAYEQLKDTLSDELLEQLKDTKFEEETEAWYQAANVKTYPNRMN